MKKLRVLLSVILLLVLVLPAFSVEPVTLESLVAAARTNNAALRAARERWNAAKERVSQASTWEKPKLTLDYWSIPEGTFDVGAATEKMYGIDQMVPFPGKLSTASKAAGYEAEAARWEYRDAELKLLADLKSAYAMYYVQGKTAALYHQAADIMEGFSKVSEARYVTGRSTQNEVLRAQVEAQKMANMALTLEQEKDTSRVEINLLIGKNADEALGEPAELNPVFVMQSWEEIQKMAFAGSPEIGKSGAMVSNRRAMKRMAELEYLPDFSVGYRRKTMNDVWSGSDLMAGISVPLWFWSQNAGVKLASAELKAAEAEQRNMALMTAAKAKESYTKLAAGRRLIELYDVSVLPRSEQSLKVAQSAFAAGRMSFLELLDSVRAYLDFRTEYYNYVADYLKNTAVLERAVGATLTDGGNK